MSCRIIILTIFIITAIGQLFAQKEDHIWIYNWSNTTNNDTFDWAGASVIDFNTIPPLVYKNSDIFLDFSEAYASICDDQGKTLYYSNGQEIHGQDHNAIVNGEIINYGPRWEVFRWTSTTGVTTTNGFRDPQEIGFILQPETDTMLVLYHNNNEYFTVGDDYNWHLMLAKITEVNGVPTVVEKDIIINDKVRTVATQACRHANGRDWWLLQYNESQVYNYLITPSGISLHHEQTLPFILERVFTGQSKFSPAGDKYAYHGLIDLIDDEGIGLMIADFDRASGMLINPQLRLMPSHENVLSNGLEFSPDGNLLYITTGLSVRQYDLTADDIYGSMQIVAEHNGINNCSISAGNELKWFGQMQLAPDNQIYISLGVQCNDVHIIRHPDVRGVGCEVEQNAIILPTFVFGTIPNVNNYRLGPLDGSAADTLGIDNHPVSRYWYEQDSLDFLSVQFWDVSYFRPEEWLWDFGDGNASSERQPEHIFAEKGVYEVCLTVSNENSENRSCQTLHLGTSSTVDSENISLTAYPNPTEGHTRFLLSGYLPQDGRLSLYDLSGQRVLSQRIRTGATVVDLSGLDLGTYVYELRDGGEVRGSGKIVRM